MVVGEMAASLVVELQLGAQSKKAVGIREVEAFFGQVLKRFKAKNSEHEVQASCSCEDHVDPTVSE